MKPRSTGFTLVELMIVIAILGLLAAVLTVAVTRHMKKASADMDAINLGQLHSAMQSAANDANHSRKLNAADSKDKSGRAFWYAVFKGKILDESMLTKLVSMGGPDDAVAKHEFASMTELPEQSCSLTAPRMGEFKQLLGGRERVVLFTFNSRNWHNYESLDRGTLTAWSDGEVAEYWPLERINEVAQVSPDEWNDPKQMFGTKKPFHKTYE
ncbi:MAG: type II secretion system protein [Planctomycetes bacterium]|nr:type II secretion system protein [Planctomycetota bacterium]MCW8136653.1 type II secretion system protein [Planctomycetota bacterium]